MTNPAWNPPASASYWINRTSRALLRKQDALLSEFGFSMSQMPVLGALADGSACSQRELAERAGVEQPTMAELLKRMERFGVVSRKDNPSDARGTLVSLTAAARKKLPKAQRALLRLEHQLLPARDVTRLVALLERVSAQLG